MSSEPNKKSRADSSFIYFEKGKNTKEIRNKISNFNKALQSITYKSDTLYPILLDYKVYYHNRLKEYDSAFIFADSLERLATFKKDTAKLALALYRKAVINRYLDNQEKVFLYAFESRKRYLQLGDSSKAARRSLEMAIAQSRLQDYTGSQESATEALHYLNKKNDGQYLSSAYNIIAIAYRNQGFYEDARKEYQNALDQSLSLADSLSYQNNIGLVYQDQKEYEKAISIFQKIYLKTPKDDYSSRARYLDNLAYAKWLQDSSAIVKDKLFKAATIRREHDKNALLTSYDHLGDYYQNKNPQISKMYADSLLIVAKDIHNKSAQLIALKKLIQLSSLEKAKNLSNRYIQLDDSLKTENLKSKNLFAKIRFDEEQKQKEIDHLETETINQLLEAKELKNQIIMLSLGGLLLVVSGGFGFYYLREKHKKEKIREAHKTESRISKKIHDELANDVYNVMSSLEAIAPAATMNRIEHIYNRTRNISRENREINTGDGYLDQLVSLLSSICPRDARLIINGEKTIAWNDLNNEKKLVIYRVLQELMINMNKHSKASLVAIIFSKEKNLLKIQYSDNGIGIKNENLKLGNGILNIENRIISIKGKIKFESKQDKGFKIRIQIPL